MRSLSTSISTLICTALLVSSFIGLSGCEPKDPSADIHDHIDQVNGSADSAAPADLRATPDPISTPDNSLRPVRALPLGNAPSTAPTAEPKATAPTPNVSDTTASNKEASATPQEAAAPSQGMAAPSQGTVTPDSETNPASPAAGSITEQPVQLEQQSEENKTLSKQADEKVDEILKETSDQP